jgi:hypothetical protein
MPHWDLAIRAESVVYIHGIGNKVAAPQLKLEWDHAVFTRDLGERSSMAYWADIRYREPLRANTDLAPPTASMTEVDEVSVDDAAQIEAVSEAVPVEVENRVAAAEFDSSFLRELTSAESAVLFQPVEAALIDPTAPIPGLIRKPGFWLTSKLFIPDAHAYFFNRTQREAIKDRLRRALGTARSPVLLVAHSLGSIISYDVLHENDFADLEVAAFITSGLSSACAPSRTACATRSRCRDRSNAAGTTTWTRTTSCR